ncbi:GNAT family N-acetyltransferase [Shewanella sp. Isolate13]|uniref:GNAT family N-acetyltransferase n=1 Tax=Shewanella sp. Isolate13 TaxID=2908531 RepID=UPI001EFC4197|nr:GNAT family N-acetyltransferase [Shewanella sp. Isolate13]MCG9732083.1 GNAT family N-acetyltransferase [Shewanella sp. Isolate13]
MVFEQDGKLLGFGFIDVETACLESLFVTPQSAGQGVGKALAIELERQALPSGLNRLSLSSSLNAQGFYQSLGYVVSEPTA